jgi:hypothetical protein
VRVSVRVTVSAGGGSGVSASDVRVASGTVVRVSVGSVMAGADTLPLMLGTEVGRVMEPSPLHAARPGNVMARARSTAERRLMADCPFSR